MRFDQVVGIFARTPVRGEVKTRLSPTLTADEALQLHEAMLADTIDRVREAIREIAVPILWWSASWTPTGEIAAALAGIETRVQQGSDLGERMARAFQDLLHSGASRALLVGADTPTLPPDRIIRGLALLADHDVVIGPAEDGGYYLIGARRLHPSLFMKMPWGTPKVLALTRKRLRAGGIPHAELPPWHDIDTPEDLTRLWHDLRQMKQKGLAALPMRTWRVLSAIAPGRL